MKRRSKSGERRAVSGSKIDPDVDRKARILRSPSFRPFGEISHRWGPRLEAYFDETFRTQAITSMARTRDYLRWFLEFIGERPINQKTLGDYVKVLQDRNPTTAGRSLVYVRGFIRQEVEEGRFPRKLLSNLRVPQESPAISRPISLRQYTRLIETAGSEELVWLYVLGWNTGMSASDCAELRFDEIDFDQLVIRKKRRKMRLRKGGVSTIPFVADGEIHLRLLRFYNAKLRTKSLEPDSFVCDSLADLSLRGLLTARVNYHLRKQGVKGGFRVFRVAFAESLHRSGADVVNVMRMLGHSDPKTTQRYLPTDIEKLRRDLGEATCQREIEPRTVNTRGRIECLA